MASRREALRAQSMVDREVVDPKPLELGEPFERPPTMRELIQQHVRQEIGALAHEHELGDFTEEDDFSEPDGEPADMLTPYQITVHEAEAENAETLDGEEGDPLVADHTPPNGDAEAAVEGGARAPAGAQPGRADEPSGTPPTTINPPANST